MRGESKWMNPRSARETNGDSSTEFGSSGQIGTPSGRAKTASLLPATTNAEAGVYDTSANQGRGAAASATKEYGAEAVRLLGMIGPVRGSDVVTDKDREFVLDMLRKAQQYGSGFVASQRQVFWLRSIKDRLLERGEI